MSGRAKRFLVTGGVGFIGSHLAEALLAAGHEVLCVDDFSTGAPANVSHLRANPRLRVLRGDAGDERLLRNTVDRIDGVFHLAASVGVRLILAQPVRTIENNVTPTNRLLRECARRGVRVVLASTSEVYGRGGAAPFREDADPILGPPTSHRWAYACSKLLDEFLAFAFRRELGLPVSVARLFNTVGPRQSARYGMVVPTFVGQALRGEPLTVYGDGTQTRSFCHVQDTVRGLCALMERPEALGEVINLGGRREISIRALAELVRERTGAAVDIRTVPYEEAYEAGFEDMPRRVPAIEKAERLLDWQPQIPLESIIDEVRTELASRPAPALGGAS